jgi:hypothetical protein
MGGGGYGGVGEMQELVMKTKFVALERFRVVWNGWSQYQKSSKSLNDFSTAINLAGVVPLSFVKTGFRWAGAASGAKSFGGAKSFLESARTVNNLSRYGVGGVTLVLNFIDAGANPDGWQTHNTIDLITGTASMVFPVFGLVYGITDLGFSLFTGKGISQHVEEYIKKKS